MSETPEGIFPTGGPQPGDTEHERLDGLELELVADLGKAERAALRALAGTLDAEGPAGFVQVKTSRVRRVLHGALPLAGGGTLAVHVKVFRGGRVSDLAREAIRGARARNELHHLIEARRRGLPVVTPLAAGVHRGAAGTRSFLVTRTLAGATPLPRGPLPAPVARDVGVLLRRAHDVGLYARDLHPGNVLVTDDGALHLVDLTSVQFGDPLDRAARARALAYFCGDLDGGLADPAARELATGYGVDEELLRLAVRDGRRLRRQALVAFGRRAGRPCRHTVVEKERRAIRRYLHVPAADSHAAARAALATLGDVEPLRRGRRGAVWVLDQLIVKERPAARSRALFRNAYLLLFAGVPTATPVLCETRERRGVVVTRRIPAPDVAAQLAAGPVDPAILADMAGRLGDAVGRLHAHGLRNRDLKFENLVRDPADGTVRMVDLEGVRQRGNLERRGIAADLGRLLAAFHAAGRPGGKRVLARFRRSYNLARQCLLLSKLDDHTRRLTEARASAWASDHRSTEAAS